MWRPDGGLSRLTWRRLKVLAHRLPPESQFKSEIRDNLTAEQWEAAREQDADPAWGPWSKTDSLLGTLVDAVRGVQWAVIAVNSAKHPPHPEPLDRPGVGAPLRAAIESKRSAQVEQIVFLEALRRNNGGDPTPEQVQAVYDELTAGGDGDE